MNVKDQRLGHGNNLPGWEGKVKCLKLGKPGKTVGTSVMFAAGLNRLERRRLNIHFAAASVAWHALRTSTVDSELQQFSPLTR